MKKKLVTLSLAGLMLLAAQGCAKKHPAPAPGYPAEPPFMEESLFDEEPAPTSFSGWRKEPDRAAPGPDQPNTRHSKKARPSRSSGRDRAEAPIADMAVRLAKTTLGTPYVFGGSSRSGFDCSGLVHWTYRHFGINLPRRAADQSRMGRPIRDTDDLRAGDLVTFRHPKRGYHIGIYVGDGKFIHSPQRNKNVTIVSLDDDYFRRIYTGARRLDTDDVSNSRLEEVEDLINSYKEDVRRRKGTSGKEQRAVRKAASRRDSHTSARRSRTSTKESAASRRQRAARLDAANHGRKPAQAASRSSQTRKKLEVTVRPSKRDQTEKRRTAAQQQKVQRKKAAAQQHKRQQAQKTRAKKTSSSDRNGKDRRDPR
ncbi:MAG: NlpC/P60 family protein [Desulfovibrionaceae bacterium]